MANYEILVEFKNGTGGGGSQFAGVQASTGATSPLKETSNPSFLELAKSLGAIALAKDVGGWVLDIVGRNSGSTDLQQRIQAVESVSTQLIAIGAATLINPLVGATVAAGTVLSYAKQAEQYQFEKRWENYALGEARLRAGAGYNRSRY